MSAVRSSTFSMPTDSLSKPFPIPARARSCSLNAAWDMVTG